MEWFLHGETQHLLAVYGYWAVAGAVALECVGLPLPGESALVAAAIYAGSTHRLNIGLVIFAAAMGAAIGGSCGFWLGRAVGHHQLMKYGRYIHLTEQRIKLGRYLFWRHGGKLIFFCRFIAILRTIAAILAGVNRMPWIRFFVFNAIGGAVWAATYGFGAYAIGDGVKRLSTPMAIVAFAAAAVAVIAAYLFLRSHEQQLQAEAERRYPGPLGAEAESA
jgi:membrane protein DedA with SNARE-associated domain